MAGDWIKFEVSTSDKPEVWAMADELGIDADAVVGKLLRVWSWFDQQTPDGNANSVTSSVTSSVTKSLLDRRVGVSGFCDAMVSVGWMLESGGIVSLPNFDRHNGKTAKTRALTAKRVANHKTKSNAISVTSSVSDALPREEKRREENKNTHTLPAPDWLAKDWKRWCDYREARDGRPMDAILSETVLMDLMRRGDGKAQRDVEFSILKQAKSILDSDNDFAKRTGQTSTGTRRYGKPTAEEIRKQQEAENPPTAEDIESRNKILKLSKEIYDESVRR